MLFGPAILHMVYIIDGFECDVDPESTSVSEFIELINRAEIPLGF